MTKFKSLYSEDSLFNFKGVNYRCQNYIFETDNSEMIAFLVGNANYELVEDTKKAK